MDKTKNMVARLNVNEEKIDPRPRLPVDFKGDNGDYQFTPEQVADYELDPTMSLRVSRKYDKRILPVVTLMYLFAALDRGNVSNAKSDGMDTDLGFTGNQYNIMLSVFFVPYCTFPYVGTILTKRFGATRMLPIYMTGWGIMATVNAAVTDFAGCLVVRLILGCFEGCFGASLFYYLAAFYTREELGKRNAAWYSMVAVSGAFSGLLAFGLFQAKTALHGWQLLFIIEGVATLVMAAVSFVVLPPYPTKAKFLTEEEKTVGVMRLLKDASDVVNAEFTWRGYLEPATEWQTWVWALYCVIYGCANQTASVFLTQIIGRFGKSVVITNVMTVGPYGVATIVLWAVTISSDRRRERTFHVMFANSLVVIGAITLACLPVTSLKAGYFCTFLIASGSFIPSVIFQSFVQNNTISENGRAFRSAIMNFGSNSAGLVSSNIFLEQFAPKYTQPLIISASIAATGIALLAALRTYMVLDNRRRNKAQGVNWTSADVPTAALKEGIASPSYRHFL